MTNYVLKIFHLFNKISYIHPRHSYQQPLSYFRKGTPAWTSNKPYTWSQLDQGNSLETHSSKPNTNFTKQRLDAKDAEIEKLKLELEAQKNDFESRPKEKDTKVQILRYSNRNLQKAIWACDCTNAALIDLNISQWFVPQCEDQTDSDTEMLLSMHDDCLKSVEEGLRKIDNRSKTMKH